MEQGRRMQTEELWADVDGFDDYQVSNQGRIQNTKTGVYLKPSGKGQTPRRVSLNVGFREKYTRLVARLVAEAFLEGYSEDYEVHYKTKDRADCSINNIYISDHKVRGRAKRK